MNFVYIVLSKCGYDSGNFIRKVCRDKVSADNYKNYLDNCEGLYYNYVVAKELE